MSKRRKPQEQSDLDKLRKTLAVALQRLPQIERQVLECRMGLVDGDPMKPGETGERLGLSIHEIKQIETRGIDRLREIGALKGLEKFLGSTQ